MTKCGRRHEVGSTIAGEVRGGTDAEDGKLGWLARLEFRFAPIAWLFGVGLAGFGISGCLGAGVALMLPATAVFVGALVNPTDGPGGRSEKKKKTLRHGYLLWLDRQARKLDRRTQLRRERKQAERDFLERRAQRSGRGR